MPALEVDFGLSATDYGRHRQGYPAEVYQRLAAAGLAIAGKRILDVGTGTGLLARDLAQMGGQVTGLDPSEALLSEARLASQAITPPIAYVQGMAENTGLAAASFDVVTAATCWHWFDRSAAAMEAARLLVPRGKLVILHMDWWKGPSGIVASTIDIINAHSNERGQRAGTFRYPEWLDDIRQAGFPTFEMFGFTTALQYSHEGWRGRVRASARVGPAMNADQLREFDAALSAHLQANHALETLSVEHRVFGLVATKSS
ncbi:MAG: class I SAM-dependent methyltransferase [Bosea sp. (in: a-proteobacteria)]